MSLTTVTYKLPRLKIQPLEKHLLKMGLGFPAAENIKVGLEEDILVKNQNGSYVSVQFPDPHPHAPVDVVVGLAGDDVKHLADIIKLLGEPQFQRSFRSDLINADTGEPIVAQRTRPSPKRRTLGETIKAFLSGKE